MTAVRRRGKAWEADYYDATGHRVRISCPTKAEAKASEARGRLAAADRRHPAVSPNITFGDYAERWLRLNEPRLKRRSLDSYHNKLQTHVLPTLGAQRLRHIRRPTIRTLLVEKRAAGLSASSVRLIHATISTILSHAVDEEVLASNPAAGLRRSLGLRAQSVTEHIKAFDLQQLTRFLAGAQEKTPGHWPLWMLMSRTGLRIGEALGLQWGDVDLDRGDLRVERSLSNRGIIDTPKAGHGRTVDLSRSAVGMLRDLEAQASADALRRGFGTLPADTWLFPRSEHPTVPVSQRTAGHAFRRALRAARLPIRFSPHCLRHTYASILLAAGVPAAYVQQQLGHARIGMTVDLYGRWLRRTAPDGSLDILDGAEGPGVPGGVVANRPHSVTTPDRPPSQPLDVAVGSGDRSTRLPRTAGSTTPRCRRG